MKTLLLITAVGILSLEAAIPSAPKELQPMVVVQPQNDKELAWVDEQIRAILPSRVGVADGFINSLKDPMRLKGSAISGKAGSSLLAPPKLGSSMVLPPKIVEEPLRLMALMNQSALISGKWYKLGQNVREYTVNEVKQNSVLLTGKKGQKLILFLTKPNNNIKITTK